MVLLRLGVMALVLVCVSALAQDVDTFPSTDDLGRFQELVELGLIPSQAAVDREAEAARTAFEAGDCQAALPLLESWARNANWLANLIRQGLEPYYSAGYDERNDLPSSRIRPLVPFEALSNGYLAQRNEAMVSRADCLVKLGDPVEAIAVYSRALDLISIQEWELWQRATNGLYSIIGVGAIE